MFKYLDFQKLNSILQYDQYDPLYFTTILFFFLFLIVVAVYRLLSPYKNIRVAFLILFSAYFYYKAAGNFLTILFGTAIINYLLGLGLNKLSGIKRKLFFIFGLLFNIGLLGYFKYTNFFLQNISSLFEYNYGGLNIILPIGISFYVFKSISYLIEINLENIEPEKNILNFILYITFFANVLAGPIDRANYFLENTKEKYFLTKQQIGTAVFLIVLGLLKKVVIADYIGLNFVDRVFDAPERFTGVENLIAVYGYTLQIYCDFSGYSDMAIGLALLLGFRLMQNFNSPYKATSVADFWRRWHISLSSWLLDYLFKPMQIKFRNLRIYGNALALTITFLICGLWHGANWTFIFWGGLHAFYMVVGLFLKRPKEKLYKKLSLSNTWILKAAQIFITFHLIAFAWIFFRVKNFDYARVMLEQIFSNFQSEVFPQFVSGFVIVFVLIVLGYLVHFLPEKIEFFIKDIIVKIPLPAKAFILAAGIWIAAQFKFADLQPFLYFQF
ncbi:MAG TPA: MBOAT family O-acyltransferase [Ignavibacteriaceae bacterium]|nr:MBOAT family O-acyltransferase [Ignavibacteriaceae bacterium]